MEERVMKKFALGLLAASLLLAAAQPVAAAEYELHLNMPLPPTNTRWELFLDGVMTDLEERSGGRIKVVPYFAESMSKISECFETVKTGLADLTEVALLNAPASSPSTRGPGTPWTRRASAKTPPPSCISFRRNSPKS